MCDHSFAGSCALAGTAVTRTGRDCGHAAAGRADRVLRMRRATGDIARACTGIDVRVCDLYAFL